ncbi:MAG: DUF805 domain-containing protein [Ferrovibrio sp.]|uniref:DUF805 domain-containing protein n=1 Tax=Ferrovibrio sp. TaxID=1917215 RepID=UPI003918C265
MVGEPFYRDLFRFSGRRRRGSYFNLVLVALFLSLPFTFIAFALNTIQHDRLVDMLIWLYAIPAAIAMNIAGAQRCRDIDWSGWIVLLTYIPVIGLAVWLVLIFYPGTRGPNRYGPDPLAEAGGSAS